VPAEPCRENKCAICAKLLQIISQVSSYWSQKRSSAILFGAGLQLSRRFVSGRFARISPTWEAGKTVSPLFRRLWP
jgi:hypothetical protein